jgi:hypothetical protein
MKVFKVRDGAETHWVIAASVSDAIDVLRENDFSVAGNDFEVYVQASDFVLGIKGDAGDSERRTCQEWLAREGRGLLASSVF